MNRRQLRELKNLPIQQFEKAVNDTVYMYEDNARRHAYILAWASVFLALADRYPGEMTAEMIHSIAVDTLEYCNGIEPASELAARLKERTGFDIFEKPSESDLEYIPKGEQQGGDHGDH